MGTYDFLFKVPVTASPSYDGIRDMDISFQQGIDGLVDELLEEHKIPRQRLDPEMDRNLWAREITRALLPKGGCQKSLFETQ
jgi:hypothetical protein